MYKHVSHRSKFTLCVLIDSILSRILSTFLGENVTQKRDKKHTPKKVFLFGSEDNFLSSRFVLTFCLSQHSNKNIPIHVLNMAASGKKLGKLSLAILENFVEGTLGRKFVEELRAPTDRTLGNSALRE